MPENETVTCPHCHSQTEPGTVERGPYAGRLKCGECGKTWEPEGEEAAVAGGELKGEDAVEGEAAAPEVTEPEEELDEPVAEIVALPAEMPQAPQKLRYELRANGGWLPAKPEMIEVDMEEEAIAIATQRLVAMMPKRKAHGRISLSFRPEVSVELNPV